MTPKPKRPVRPGQNEIISLITLVAMLGIYGVFACVRLWKVDRTPGDLRFYAWMYGLPIVAVTAATIFGLLRLRRKLKAMPSNPIDAAPPLPTPQDRLVRLR